MMQDTWNINGKDYKANKEQLELIRLSQEKCDRNMDIIVSKRVPKPRTLDAGQEDTFPARYWYILEVCQILGAEVPSFLEGRKKAYLRQFRLDEIPTEF